MKGVILAGGQGTRLRPLTNVTNKHLLPVYDKPMILYPVETLKTAGITDIMIVTGGNHVGRFAEFLGTGDDYGVSLSYKVQKEAGGIAEALGLTRSFVGNDKVLAILGDNIFDNSKIEWKNVGDNDAMIFGKEVEDPERFGVITYEGKNINEGSITSIDEKPKEPKSKIAVVGLYQYPSDVFDFIETLKPSARGELEITDVNNYYLNNKRLKFGNIGGFWSDAGTFDSLFRSSEWAKKG